MLTYLFNGRCAACFRTQDLQPATGASALKLCGGCRDELDELRLGRLGRPAHTLLERARGPRVPDESWRLMSLYRYEGVVRQLILRAKVQGDLRALRLLVELCVSALRDTDLGRPTTDRVVWMPCPSSLWGRLRGRFDVAWHLGAALAERQSGARLVPAPLALHWRWHKRARLGTRQERSAAAVSVAPDGPLAAWGRRVCTRLWLARHSAVCADSRLVIVDDIVTTGQTLGDVARSVSALTAPAGVRLVTFATARGR